MESEGSGRRGGESVKKDVKVVKGCVLYIVWVKGVRDETKGEQGRGAKDGNT